MSLRKLERAALNYHALVRAAARGRVQSLHKGSTTCHSRRVTWLLAGILMFVLAACQVSPAPTGSDVAQAATTPNTATPALSPEATSTPEPTASITATVTATVTTTTATDAPYLLFNQRWIEGFTAPGFDLEDPDEMLWQVFSRLPDAVTIYPSENYYYFIFHIEGRQIWGNIRLPAGRRDRGVLSLGYFEFDEFASGVTPRISRSKFFTDADGVLVDQVDRFTYDVRYNRKTVRFHLHQLSQELPAGLDLGENEIFVQRTFDESGYQFYLIFNTDANYFFWVLNEEETVPDVFDPVEDDLVVGRRSGFAFWIDAAYGNRKVLMAIRQISVSRNDYYDGPFDQLADNYADETNVSEYMQRAYPALRGRIDKFGYYTDQERPMRVAISTYFTYYTQADLREIVGRVREADDPYQTISRRGYPSQEEQATEEEAPVAEPDLPEPELTAPDAEELATPTPAPTSAPTSAPTPDGD